MLPKDWRKKEKWKPLPEYNEVYLISNMGRVKRARSRKKSAKLLNPTLDTGNRISVRFTHPETKVVRKYNLKDVVARLFLRPRPLSGNRIVLKDKDDIFNISVSNLKELGRKKKANTKLSEDEKEYILKRWNEMSYKWGLKRRLAEELEVHWDTIHNIITGRQWKRDNRSSS